MSLDGQISIFDWMPTAQREPEIGEWLEYPGAIIPHIMRPSYIGKKVLINLSTQSHEWYKCGILEDYIRLDDGHYRSIVYTGERQRSLVTHLPGVNIYECRPWDFEARRSKTND